MRSFPESDWKHLRKIRPVALDRLCKLILGEIATLAADDSHSHHERYLKIYERVHKRDEDIARAFNDPRRSRAVLQLAAMSKLELLAPDEMAGFSEETQERIRAYL